MFPGLYLAGNHDRAIDDWIIGILKREWIAYLVRIYPAIWVGRRLE
jgi:hypothetical protein